MRQEDAEELEDDGGWRERREMRMSRSATQVQGIYRLGLGLTETVMRLTMLDPMVDFRPDQYAAASSA